MPVEHIVKEGETLFGISEQYLGEGSLWETISGYEGDPKLLPIGTSLTIPDAPEGDEVMEIDTEDAREDIDTDKDKLEGFDEVAPTFPEKPNPWQTFKFEGVPYIYNPNKAEWTTLEASKEEIYKEPLTPEEKLALGDEEVEDPDITALQSDIDKIDADLDTAMSDLDAIRVAASAASKALIASIQKTFTQRRDEMRDVNERSLASLRSYGIRTGGLRYSPLTTTGILSAEERAGIGRISKLDSEEAMLIAEAQQASLAQDWTMLSDKIESIEEKRDEKVEELKGLQEIVNERNLKLAEQAIKTSRQSSILDLMSQGVMDVASVFNSINYDEKGNLIGDITLDEINETFDFLLESAEVSSPVDKFTDFEGNRVHIYQDPNGDLRSVVVGKEYQEEDMLSVNDSKTLGIPFGSTVKEAQAMGIIPTSDELSLSKQVDVSLKLSSSFENFAKRARASSVQIAHIGSAYIQAQTRMATGESINASSQGVLVAFQKLLDPTSVVRESEYARSSEGISIMGRMEGSYQKLSAGGAGLTADDLKEFVDMGNKFLKNYQNEMLDFARRVQTQAENWGLNLENILTPEVISLLEEQEVKEGEIKVKEQSTGTVGFILENEFDPDLYEKL